MNVIKKGNVEQTFRSSECSTISLCIIITGTAIWKH